MSKIAIFHTNCATPPVMKKLATKLLPDVEVLHIIEDSMIDDVMRHHGVTPAIAARIAGYITIAQQAGCSHFMTACSSIGYAVEQCQFMTSMRLIRIDEAMIEKAIDLGQRIAVLATAETTLTPTLEFIERKAREKHKHVSLSPLLMADAFQALLTGDDERHDQIVKIGLAQACENNDVVVLAQASMARVLRGIEKPTVTVLTSPELSMRWLKQEIDEKR